MRYESGQSAWQHYLVTSLGIVFFGLLSVPVDAKELCPPPPSWGLKIQGPARFVRTFETKPGSKVFTAYCDRETGLVWPRMLGDSNGDGEFTRHFDNHSTWGGAIEACHRLNVGGRMGWHLALSEQLLTLIDTSSDLCSEGRYCLPDDHPFIVQGRFLTEAGVWTATTRSEFPEFAVAVLLGNPFGNGPDVGEQPKSGGSGALNVFCVRGGQVFDGNSHETLH